MTDHRLGRTVHGVEELLSGGDQLEGVVVALQSLEEAQALEALTCRTIEELDLRS